MENTRKESLRQWSMRVKNLCVSRENAGNIDPHIVFICITGGFFRIFFLCTVFNTASSAAPQIPLCRSMLGSNFGIGSQAKSHPSLWPNISSKREQKYLYIKTFGDNLYWARKKIWERTAYYFFSDIFFVQNMLSCVYGEYAEQQKKY